MIKIYKRIIDKIKFLIVKKYFTNEELLYYAYKKIGILNFGNEETTGENYVLKNILPSYFETEEPILFDVGANVGNYSRLLRRSFSKAKIYSFEPNQNAFEIAQKESTPFNIQANNIGLGATSKSASLYSYKKINNTELGTCHPEALKILYDKQIDDEVEEIKIEIEKIDNFCHHNNIKRINFLKIDVEGYELEVLKGASQMIANNQIDIIQFEFNEFNAIYRVFLRDFYLLLENYNFYRVNCNELISLGGYNTINEIFKYQNILAISKHLTAK